MRQIPYGQINFLKIRSNWLYLDKTQYMEQIKAYQKQIGATNP